MTKRSAETGGGAPAYRHGLLPPVTHSWQTARYLRSCPNSFNPDKTPIEILEQKKEAGENKDKRPKSSTGVLSNKVMHSVNGNTSTTHIKEKTLYGQFKIFKEGESLADWYKKWKALR